MSRPVGMLEWLQPGEYDRAEELLEDLRAIDVQHLRTGLSWADYHTPEGPEWYDWLLPKLAREVELLPCLHYTPPVLGIEAKISSPPREPRMYADWLDVVITRYGRHFKWVELWNEPNNISEWDWRLDPRWHVFSEMVGGAAYWARQRGKRTVLGGMATLDCNWLSLMSERGVLAQIDAVGVHAFPGTWEVDWPGWNAYLERLRETLRGLASTAQIWVTETGYSTWRSDESHQAAAFLRACDAGADRVYWYGMHDLAPGRATIDGFHLDEREYHFGIKKVNGTAKLLYRLLTQGGQEEVRRVLGLMRRPVLPRRSDHTALVTGGAGFIGTNLAHRLLRDGRRVIVYDNLSRPGTEQNLQWLVDTHGPSLDVRIEDVRDVHALQSSVTDAESVFHLAAQVAVTASLSDPVSDFAQNAGGALNMLEAVRAQDPPPKVLFTSTNKVYGSLREFTLEENGARYQPADGLRLRQGVDEKQPLDFHSPYGCSKGAADQYVLDYARCYGIPSAVFRMSCIYGPHQHGTEDQGWVAHFLRRALNNEPITIYGNGKQVRDLLFVDDLVEAFLHAERRMGEARGNAFNIGGGPAHSVSLLELLELLGRIGDAPVVTFCDWRQGDQKYYVSNTWKFRRLTGWRPSVGVEAGIRLLRDWLAKERISVGQTKGGRHACGSR